MKKLSNEEFTEQTEMIVFQYSIMIAVVLLIVMAFFGLRFVVSALVGYLASLFIFFKDNRIINGLLYKRMLYPKFWMVTSNIISCLVYVGIGILFLDVAFFTLWGITGLFVMEIASIIASIVHRK